MKILYFHQHFSTPKGSTGTRSYEMSQRLLARGHSVTMVCGSYSGGCTCIESPFVGGRRRGFVDGIDVVEFDLAYSNNDSFLKRTVQFLKFAFKSIRLVFTEEYDLIFATTTPLTAGIPGIFARWFRRKPFVFEVRDLWPELPKAMGVLKNPLVLCAMSLLEWLSYHSAHRLIGLAPGIVSGIERRGVSSDKITLIPNGSDLTIFEKPQNCWRPEGVGKEDLLAVFSGTHGIANGLDAVLDTAIELKRRRRKDIKIVLVGQGKLKASLAQRTAREELDGVVFLPPVDKHCLAGLLGASDVGLQVLANVPAFYYGTSPNKFFDYLASGLPVLTNYPGWIADLVYSNQCGFTVPPEDEKAFADVLEKAADDRQNLKEMGKRSQLLAIKEFDRQKLAERFVDWLEEAVLSKKTF
jgi:glycosyltransferase involved in cell wall biosynthesis